MQSKLESALGLCRKAGALSVGYDAVQDAVRAGRATLVLTAEDLSPNSREKTQRFCEGMCEVRGIPLKQAQLALAAGKPAGIVAVCNANLAELVRRNLCADGLE